VIEIVTDTQRIRHSRPLIGNAPTVSLSSMVEVVENCWHDWWVVDEARVMEVFLCDDGDGLGAMERALDRARQYIAPGHGFLTLTHGTDWRSMAFDHVRWLGCEREPEGWCTECYGEDKPDGWCDDCDGDCGLDRSCVECYGRRKPHPRSAAGRASRH